MGYAPYAQAYPDLRGGYGGCGCTQGFQEAFRDTQRRQAAEVRLLEEELRRAREAHGWAEPLPPEPAWPPTVLTPTVGPVGEAWLQGPVTCIEHQAVRRQHAEKMHQLQELRSQLADAEHRIFTDTLSMPRSGYAPSPQINQWAEVLTPSEVVANRQRRFGSRLFRLWVEDLAERRGVRVHAMDTQSFLRSSVELSDVDLQAMFDHWFLRLSRGRQATLQAPLKQFLLQLLDAAYFDLEPDGSGQLRLRVPSVIPALPPEPHQELIEVPSRRDRSRSTQEAELSKEWIRDKILVPKSMVSGRSSSQGRLKAPRPSSGYGCYARAAERHQRTGAGPPRPARPSSARIAELASPRTRVSQSTMSECLPATASYDSVRERCGVARPRSSTGLRLRWPLEEREQARRSSFSAPQVRSEASRMRPSSAKDRKHKRVEAWNEEDIYDDLEPSLAGDLDHCSEFGQDPDPFGRAIFESLEPTTPPPRGGWMEEDAMRFQQGMM